MATVALSGPFGSERMDEVVLAAAPLARVICQIRFPRLTRLAASDEAANTVAAALADDYPVFNQAREVTIMITPDGVTQTPGGGQVWQLGSADGTWQVSFGAEFLAVHTAAYTTRDAFTEKLAQVVEVFGLVVAVPHCERIGIRYINRIDSERVSLAELPALVRPEMRGGLAVPLANAKLVTAMSEALYDLAPPTEPTPPGVPAPLTDGLQARWGLLPSMAQLDPTLSALPRPSWVLDLDAFRVALSPFTRENVAGQVDELAERAYRYFRWVVTEEFLTRFGKQT
ncbi:MAG TPA: TIGR04255 family protein [Mycobacteriales bacterium]|nr:TIGR04255 family protein [Mycobacteriales bacterium]